MGSAVRSAASGGRPTWAVPTRSAAHRPRSHVRSHRSLKLNAGKEFAATLGSVSVRDVDISDKSKVAGAATYDVLHGWAVRRQSDGSRYNVRLRFSASGKSTLGVTRRNGGASTWLGGVALPTALRAGQVIRGGVQVTGTSPVTIKARVWVDGAANQAGS